MLFVSAISPQFSVPPPAQGVELRLDLFSSWSLKEVEKWLVASPFPLMITLRKSSQGGKFQGSEEEREKQIEELLRLKPPFFDLEADMRPSFLEAVFQKYPHTKIVLSFHDFVKTPRDLEQIYSSMKKYPAFTYKIAAMAHSTNDALRMLLFARKFAQVSAICMGEKGAFARILGPVVGNRVDYARLNSQTETGPNQWTLSELENTYYFPFLNPQTEIYGLIGDPIEKSPGPSYHNRAFREKHRNAVYVKMTVRPEELSDFFSLAKELGIRGLSVTIPLKEHALSFVDKPDVSVQQIGAVNTLVFQKGKIVGTNTDGKGALDALEKKLAVHGKKIVLLGAGGAARALIFEAKERGADVCILNRTVSKAKDLAIRFGCSFGSLEDVPLDYDVLINASPDPMPIDPQKMQPRKVVMDIAYSPRETLFLKRAAELDCRLVFGEEMFFNQAARQTNFWLKYGQ